MRHHRAGKKLGRDSAHRSDSITLLRSGYYMIKVMLAVAVASIRKPVA